jgi:hypothetical protein
MRSISAALLAVGAILSCATPASSFPFIGHHGSARSGDLGELVYRATDRMIENMRPRPGNAGVVTPVDQVIVATVVSVDDLDSSSTLGRLASQLVLSRLTQLGYQAKDVTYLRALEISPEGERVLSRDARRLSKDYDASAVVVGTYAVGGQTIFLNLRLLSAEDGALISTADVVIPLNDDTWPMVDAKAPRLTRNPEALIYGPRRPVARAEPSDER